MGRLACLSEVVRRSLLRVGIAVLLSGGVAQAQSAGTEAPLPAPLPAPEREVRLRYDLAPTPRLVTLLVTRLTAELKVSGFSVLLPSAAEAAPPSAAEAPSGYAEIALSATTDRVQLEITSRSLSASSHVLLIGTEREVGALALQATEYLRAGLIPRATPATTSPSEREPQPAPQKPPPMAARGRWLLDLGATGLTNLGARDALGLLSLASGYAWAERASLSVGIDVPLTSATFSSERGSAEYRLWLGQLFADYAWLRGRQGEATLGLSAGLVRVTTVGRPRSPLEAAQAEAWSLSLGARVTGQLRVSPALALLAQARVVSLSPNPVVAILADERRLGSPSLLFELGLRLGGRGF